MNPITYSVKKSSLHILRYETVYHLRIRLKRYNETQTGYQCPDLDLSQETQMLSSRQYNNRKLRISMLVICSLKMNYCSRHIYGA
jgi:hypothetical protein